MYNGKEERLMLNEEMVTLITSAFADMKSTVSQVLAISVPVIVGIICLNGGIRFALGKLRAVLNWA